jgi:hypothetical protein
MLPEGLSAGLLWLVLGRYSQLSHHGGVTDSPRNQSTTRQFHANSFRSLAPDPEHCLRRPNGIAFSPFGRGTCVCQTRDRSKGAARNDYPYRPSTYSAVR